MSFLSPWYALAALAIALPILFHLIRRQPKGNLPFSSLMFLDPSPPRLTKRSRVDQWFLLFLRIAAILLIAAAFARPFWNDASQMELKHPNERRLILLDTSASMRRDGVWDQAIDTVKKLVANSNPDDTLALYTFDQSVQAQISFEASNNEATKRTSLFQSILANLKPTWERTNLGLALVTASDVLRGEEDNQSDENLASRGEIVVVTDYTTGSDMERLSNYQWPSNCRVRIERIQAPPGNLRMNLLSNDRPTIDSKTENSTPLVSVRLVNQPDATREQFTLQWCDAQGKPLDREPTQTTVPPGTTILVKIAAAPDRARMLQLSGDSAGFDDQHFVVLHPPVMHELVCIDDVNKTSSQSFGFFPQQVPLHDRDRRVQFVWRSPDSQDAWIGPERSPLHLASASLSDRDAQQLHAYLEQGGHLLFCLDQSVSVEASASRMLSLLRELVGDSSVGELQEADHQRDAMIEWVDFNDPLFRPLADPRFNDFAKIRFWHHRKWMGLTDAWRVLARFDDGSPALVTRSIGKGRMTVLTAGWQPTESQLALSSKFVPLLWGLFQAAVPPRNMDSDWLVGDRLELVAESESWTNPQGKALEPIVDGESRFIVFNQPGIYQGIRDGKALELAVNIDPRESEVQVADLDLLERLGVQFTKEIAPERELASRRQLQAVELEAEQGWWRWLLISVVTAIALESIISIWRGTRHVGYASGE